MLVKRSREWPLFWFIFTISFSVIAVIIKFIVIYQLSITEEGCTGFPIFIMTGGNAVFDCARDAPLSSVGQYDN